MKEKKEAYIQAIKVVYPELKVQYAHFFDHDGQYSDILIVNYESPEEMAALLTDFRQYLFPFMRPDARQWADDHFENFLNAPGLASQPISIRHGDFGLGNILYDPEHLTITGIIDFSFVGLGDPAIDIAAASTLGPDLFDHFKRTYRNYRP